LSARHVRRLLLYPLSYGAVTHFDAGAFDITGAPVAPKPKLGAASDVPPDCAIKLESFEYQSVIRASG